MLIQRIRQSCYVELCLNCGLLNAGLECAMKLCINLPSMRRAGAGQMRDGLLYNEFTAIDHSDTVTHTTSVPVRNTHIVVEYDTKYFPLCCSPPSHYSGNPPLSVWVPSASLGCDTKAHAVWKVKTALSPSTISTVVVAPARAGSSWKNPTSPEPNCQQQPMQLLLVNYYVSKGRQKQIMLCPWNIYSNKNRQHYTSIIWVSKLFHVSFTSLICQLKKCSLQYLGFH